MTEKILCVLRAFVRGNKFEFSHRVTKNTKELNHEEKTHKMATRIHRFFS